MSDFHGGIARAHGNLGVHVPEFDVDVLGGDAKFFAGFLEGGGVGVAGFSETKAAADFFILETGVGEGGSENAGHHGVGLVEFYHRLEGGLLFGGAIVHVLDVGGGGFAHELL